MLFAKDLGIVAPAGVSKEVLGKRRHIAECRREGGLRVSEMTVQMPQPPGDEHPAPLPGKGAIGSPRGPRLLLLKILLLRLLLLLLLLLLLR